MFSLSGHGFVHRVMEFVLNAGVVFCLVAAVGTIVYMIFSGIRHILMC